MLESMGLVRNLQQDWLWPARKGRDVRASVRRRFTLNRSWHQGGRSTNSTRTPVHSASRRRRRAIAQALWGVLAVVGLLGCGTLDDGTGDWLPSGKKTGPVLPDPIPNPSLIMATYPEGQVDILGLPGAMPGEGSLRVETSQGTFETRTAPNGSFVLEAAVSGPEIVSLTFANSEPVAFRLTEGTGTNPEWSPQTQQWFMDGEVTVSVTANKGETVIAANSRTGRTVAVVNDTVDARVPVSIPAQSGDAIRLYLLAEDGSPLRGPLVLGVP